MMGKSSSNSSSKTKKNSRDREKQKISQSNAESSNQHGLEKAPSSSKGSAKKYIGIAPETIAFYARGEQLAKQALNVFTEDINYKLRLVIYDSLVKARLSGRNYINSSDVQDSFVSFDIEKVYGAPSSPNWIPFSNTDKTLSCLEDSVVNLVSLAEQENSFIQPGDVTLTTKWLSSSGDIGWQLRNYFTAICHAVVDKDEDVRRAALVDIRTNGQIGPVVEWFYSFGFFLLRKDTSYSCLPLWGLDLIEALESNYLGPLSASELQIRLLVKLILQWLLRNVPTYEMIKPMCRVLAILCCRIPMRERVVAKIKQLEEVKPELALPIVSIINVLGMETILHLFIPNARNFLVLDADLRNVNLTYELLRTFQIISLGGQLTKELYDMYLDAFGFRMAPFWKVCPLHKQGPEIPEMNWAHVKRDLMRTRRNISYALPYREKKRLEDVFEDFDGERLARLLEKRRFPNIQSYQQQRERTAVVIGKRTMLNVVHKRFSFASRQLCQNHGDIMFHNL